MFGRLAKVGGDEGSRLDGEESEQPRVEYVETWQRQRTVVFLLVCSVFGCRHHQVSVAMCGLSWESELHISCVELDNDDSK